MLGEAWMSNLACPPDDKNPAPCVEGRILRAPPSYWRCMLAEAPGFEPGNVGSKDRCLTTWLRLSVGVCMVDPEHHSRTEEARQAWGLRRGKRALLTIRHRRRNRRNRRDHRSPLVLLHARQPSSQPPSPGVGARVLRGAGGRRCSAVPLSGAGNGARARDFQGASKLCCTAFRRAASRCAGRCPVKSYGSSGWACISLHPASMDFRSLSLTMRPLSRGEGPVRKTHLHT